MASPRHRDIISVVFVSSVWSELERYGEEKGGDCVKREEASDRNPKPLQYSPTTAAVAEVLSRQC